MTIANLDKIFEPKRIAVIGASDRSGSVGGKVLANLVGSMYRGVVYPINPKHESVQGIAAYRTVADTPHRPDLAVIATPAATVPELIDQCGEAGVGGAVILSAGFGETGAGGQTVQRQLEEAWTRHPRLRIVGPNCLGVMTPRVGLNASFAASMPEPGSIAFISQSGALCTSVLDMALEQRVGFSYFVSIGNMLDVDFADLIDYVGQSRDTRAIVLYIESITAARQFMSAARAFAREKPIIAYKSGRFEASAKAAASHTGALAGADDVFDAAFQRAGIERVYAMEDMFDCAELLARYETPRGPKLGIVTNAGGPGVMATDALIARHGTLAELAPGTIERLNGKLPAHWSHSNPVDILGDADPARYAAATEAVLADPDVDAALVILTPQAMTDPVGSAAAVVKAARESKKPVLAAWMGGAAVRAGERQLTNAGIPCYSSPEPAILAFMHMVSYAANIESLYETPREVSVEFEVPQEERRERRLRLIETRQGTDVVSETRSKGLLDLYGIPVTVPVLARDADAAVTIAQGMGGPVVMKIASPDITHKTDVSGVMLDLQGDEEITSACNLMLSHVRQLRPNARIDGVTIQRMIDRTDSVELILGVKRDPTYGMALMVGTGGTAAELFKDRALGLPLLNERLARRMLEALRSWPLLKGYRGQPGVNIEQLIEILVRLSHPAANNLYTLALHINPLIVTPRDAVAVDGRIVIDPQYDDGGDPFSHLAIRPYPERYSREVTIKTGEKVTLRPIRFEDEPLWHDMLDACSPESIHNRFFHLIKEFSHEMATRYCSIDYDREMAIVIELEQGDDRRLLGVGRLIADANHHAAEYAVIIVDDWQKRGLGSAMTEFCMEIARDWGVQRVTAVTLFGNQAMVHTFKRCGFDIVHDSEEGVIRAELDLTEHFADTQPAIAEAT